MNFVLSKKIPKCGVVILTVGSCDIMKIFKSHDFEAGVDYIRGNIYMNVPFGINSDQTPQTTISSLNEGCKDKIICMLKPTLSR